MNAFLSLSALALREVSRGALKQLGIDKGGDAVVKFLTERFTDHSQKLANALQIANERAWRALEVALAGDSLWEHVKVTLASAEDKAFREQLQAFLEASPLRKVKAEQRGILQKALEELRCARSRGSLTGGSLAPDALAREAGALATIREPQALLEAERKALRQVAEELRTSCPNLYLVLVARIDPPILVVAARYHFRRLVEADQGLFQGLAFAQLEALHANQERAYAALHEALSGQGQRLTELIAGLDAKIASLEEQIRKILNKLDLATRPVRPSDSMSLRGDAERQFVRQLVRLYRALPEDQKAALPGLLNNLGKLQVAVGDFEPARRDFADAAGKLDDPRRKAEAHHNAFRAALEQQQWGEALESFRQAVTLDPARFSAFPVHYEMQRVLGAGGFGVVFLCRHRFLQTQVVVKSLLTSNLSRDIDSVFAEARVLEDLHHPAVVRLRDCNYADGDQPRPYLVMDYFEGMNLADYVAAHGPLAPPDLMGVVRPVAEALQAAHAQGIFHRDVKPGNVLVRREVAGWKVKLIDFGLAVRPESLGEKGSTRDSHRTLLGRSIAGTLHYAAPEQMGQAPGVDVGTYSDVYGFGKTCYFALFSTPDPDDEDKERLPERWRNLLRQCTRNEAAKRLQDFAAVLAELNPPPPPVSLEEEVREALEERRTKGHARAYFERQGAARKVAWLEAAQQGNALAQWLLASSLAVGKDAEQSTKAALSWLRKAADGKLAVALADLGDRHFLGDGVKENPTKAFCLYKEAADQGFLEGQINLGDCYYQGAGVEQNLAEAIKYYRLTAEAGWARGQDGLGDCYYEGAGVKQDYFQAISWYRKAADQGLAGAQFHLGYCYEYGKGVPKDWSEAVKWFRRAAEQGDDEAQFVLGFCYQHGCGVEPELDQAETWYRRAAGQGHPRAQNYLRRVKLPPVALPEPEPAPTTEPRYWVIAPFFARDELWQQVWEVNLANGVLSVGWDELGDVSRLDEPGLRTALHEAYPDPDTKTVTRGKYFRMLWDFFHSIRPGDLVIARQGTKKVAAVGTVLHKAYHAPGKYAQALGHEVTFSNHLDVRWHDAPRDKEFKRPVFGMQTLYSIPEERFRTLVP